MTTTNDSTPAAQIALTLYRCAIETPRNDGEARTAADLVQDGGESYDQWCQESSAAGDHATQDALAAVSRADFAAAWEALIAESKPEAEPEPLTIRGSWYLDGSDYVVVVTGMPEHSVEIGIGRTVADAWANRQTTAMQSVGRDCGESAALRWAEGAGWIESADDLEPADAEAANDVSAPVGDVDWSDDVFAYVSCVYGSEGNDPGDCRVRVGEDELGLWWIQDGDDDVDCEMRGPYNTEELAREAADEWASEQNEALAGEDADDMRTRLLTEAAGEPTADGEFCVYWETVLDDEHVVARYATHEAAHAAAKLLQDKLEASHPGGNLRCGYGVRVLEDGEWVGVDNESY